MLPAPGKHISIKIYGSQRASRLFLLVGYLTKFRLKKNRICFTKKVKDFKH